MSDVSLESESKVLENTFGLVGLKLGMSRIFNSDGVSIPVTVVDVSDNRVSQIKTSQTDGYNAVQVAFGKYKQNKLNKPLSGHCSKAGVEPAKNFKEFRVDNKNTKSIKIGDTLAANGFKEGQLVDVTGVTKGKGFQGAIKRHHFSSQRQTHGNSISHRAPGSIGMCQDPGRVFKGKKMAGHLGVVNRTTQNLKIIRVDGEKKTFTYQGCVTR
jgi:large subunit ribosomal protein L3